VQVLSVDFVVIRCAKYMYLTGTLGVFANTGGVGR